MASDIEWQVTLAQQRRRFYLGEDTLSDADDTPTDPISTPNNIDDARSDNNDTVFTFAVKACGEESVSSGCEVYRQMGDQDVIFSETVTFNTESSVNWIEEEYVQLIGVRYNESSLPPYAFTEREGHDIPCYGQVFAYYFSEQLGDLIAMEFFITRGLPSPIVLGKKFADA